MPNALFISPHLDDVAFSCGGTLMRLVDEGWEVTLCTVFTKSVAKPQGFALACQLDKGLGPEVDYMQLRRAEDHWFAKFACASECIHLPFVEAPHRGYGRAGELFGGVRDDDEIWREIAAVLPRNFDYVFVPQGLGNHADHLQTIRAVEAAGMMDKAIRYQDTPYAIRNPPKGEHVGVAIDLAFKVAACGLYKTQVPFQFGLELEATLERFHRSDGGYRESFACNSAAKTSPFQSLTITRGF